MEIYKNYNYSVFLYIFGSSEKFDLIKLLFAFLALSYITDTTLIVYRRWITNLAFL